jgi:hypothetical protein
MSEAIKFADFIKNASTLERHKFADALEAAAPNMSLADLKPLVQGLTEYLNAQSAKTDKKTKRLAKMAAAKADPKKASIITLASHEMRRLGKDLDAFAAADATVSDLDKAMASEQWQPERRIKLKQMLFACGVID